MADAGERNQDTRLRPTHDLIKDPGRILRFFLKAHQDEADVEVTINERPRIFYSFFMDHLPELTLEGLIMNSLAQSGLEADHSVSRPPAYTPFSYLKDHDRLLLAPLCPSIGNAQIRSSEEVTIRFFEGIKCLEGVVQFVAVQTIRGAAALQLTYPKQLRFYRNRRFYRAKLLKETEIACELTMEGVGVIQPRLIDISVGGLAFCNPWSPEMLPLDHPVHLTLQGKGMDKVKVLAFIRNHGRATIKDDCPKDSGRCGVQFDIGSESQEEMIEALVTYVQRDYLRMVQARKKKQAVGWEEIDDEVDDDESCGLLDDLKKNLGLKKSKKSARSTH